jgi:spore coat protein U-like protein
MLRKFNLTKSALFTALVGAVATFSAPAFSQATATLGVSAVVQTACAFGSVSSPATTYSLDFGTFSIGGSDKDAQVDLSVDCASAVAYTVAVSGTPGARTMAGPGALNYDLYKNATRTTLFGATGTATFTGTGTPGLAQTVTVYGRIPQAGNSAAAVGNYTDTLTLTLTF